MGVRSREGRMCSYGAGLCATAVSSIRGPNGSLTPVPWSQANAMQTGFAIDEVCMRNGEVCMRNGMGTSASGDAGLNRGAVDGASLADVLASARSDDSGKTKGVRALLSMDHHMKDELLFAILFVAAILALLPSVSWW